MEYFSILPVDISLHIFDLLPMESVSDVALVSKSWTNLIHSPSFYGMLTVRLLRLANEAQAEANQNINQVNDLWESARPSTVSPELLVQFLTDLVGNMNSVRLSEQKLANLLRLAANCIWIWASRVPGESLFEACRRDRTEIMTKLVRNIQLSTSSGIGQADADEAVAATKPKRPSGSRSIRRLTYFWSDSVLGWVWRKIKKKQ